MPFKKRPAKPAKPSLDDLLQSGAVKTGKQIIKDQETKAKQATEFEKAAQDELRDRKSKASKR